MDTLEYITSKYNCHNAVNYPFVINNLNRKLLANLFGELGFTIGCEIGVRKGTNALHLFKTIPDLTMYLIDPYAEYDSASTTEKKLQGHYKKAKKRLKKYNAKFMRECSMDAVKKIPELSLDFIHIDGNHDSDFVMQDITKWSKRVRPGGIISGHDYYPGKNGEVKDAVDVYVRENNIACWFLCDVSTYFWVKSPIEKATAQS